MIYYIIWILLILFIFYIVFLYLLKSKIEKFEIKIIKQFKEKNNQIPSIYEITRKYLNKHDEIFKEALKLKKRDFWENGFYNKLSQKLNTYKLIHNELNFIFKVCNKHQKLNKDWKFLYIRDLIIEKSKDLGNDIIKYKQIIKQFNRMIVIKNLTVIWLLFPIEKKETI